MKSLQVLQGSYNPLTSATALLREPGSNWWPRGYDSHALPTELSRNKKTGATSGFGRRAACPEGHFLLHGFQDRSVRSNRFLRHPVWREQKRWAGAVRGAVRLIPTSACLSTVRPGGSISGSGDEVTAPYGILLCFQRTILRISERASSPRSIALITSKTFSLHPAIR